MNTCNLLASLKHNKLIRLCLDELCSTILVFFYFGKLDDLMGLSLMIVVQISPLLTYYLPIKKQKSNYSYYHKIK